MSRWPIRTLEQRFFEKVHKTDDCWIWVGASSSHGYGFMQVKQNGKWRIEAAHRISYCLVNGTIPEGLAIDHLCRNRLCVNPQHLEAVTVRENILRGVGVSAQCARRTHCPRGHSYSGGNLYIWRNKRYCRECKNSRETLAEDTGDENFVMGRGTELAE